MTKHFLLKYKRKLVCTSYEQMEGKLRKGTCLPRGTLLSEYYKTGTKILTKEDLYLFPHFI